MSLFTLSQKTVEIFAANATQQAMMIHRRVNQKKNNVLKSVPLLQKMKEKITEFDQEMTKRLGKNYTKVRNIAVGVGKFYVAGQFGGPGIIVLGAINAAKAVKPLLKNAEEQRQAGKVTGLFDYMSKHPKEAGKTMASASLGAGAIVFGLAGMLDAKFVTRAAATALVVLPEMKALKETAESIIKGEKTAKQAFKDLGNDILTAAGKMYNELTNVQNEMNSSTSCFDSQAGEELRSQFKASASKFDEFKKTMDAYGKYLQEEADRQEDREKRLQNVAQSIPKL